MKSLILPLGWWYRYKLDMLRIRRQWSADLVRRLQVVEKLTKGLIIISTERYAQSASLAGFNRCGSRLDKTSIQL